jgi:kinesin family protein 15
VDVRRISSQDELTRMKSNNGAEDESGSGYTSGWNARRSYNLLRLSLGHAMKAPLFVDNDNDDEMELDDMEIGLDAMADRLSNGTSVSQSTDMELGSPKLRKSIEEGKSDTEKATDGSSTHKDLDGTADVDSPTHGLVEGAKFSLPVLNVTKAPSDVTPGLDSPTRSHSPNGKKKPSGTGAMFGLISLAENEDVVDFGAEVLSEGMTALRSSKTLPSPSPRDRLAASLQKGLQILDNHQKSALRR